MYVWLCRWVVVHGMAGFGKTVLAAEAVRDAVVLDEIFPGERARSCVGWAKWSGRLGVVAMMSQYRVTVVLIVLTSGPLGGVHWLTLGKLTDRYGDVDGAKLLSKLQALILRLDMSNSNQQLPSVETAKNYLQKVLLT